jgi:MHS family proline/betaine transporter-like MFS transporter
MKRILLNKRVIAAAMIGNILEFYDFTLFIFLSPLISPLFFPSEDKIVSIIFGLGTVAMGYFIRPLGAVIFGYLGDKYGRKHALTLSIMMMAIPTFLIGILPTYESIGVSAACLLITLRLLQGLCTAGEYGGAVVFIVENVKNLGRAFTGGLINSSTALGGLAASAVSTLVCLPGMPSWAWRGAFILGALIGLVGVYIRRSIKEESLDELLLEQQKTINPPLIQAIKHNPKSVLCTISIAAFCGIMYNFSFYYISIFLATFQNWQLSQALSVMTGGIILYIFLAPISGALADRFGERKVMMAGAIGTIFVIYPIFLLLTRTISLQNIIIAQLALTILCAWFQGPANFYMAKLFSRTHRYTGLTFSYMVGVALFGGTTPMIITLLIKYTGNYMMPALYIGFGALIGLLAVNYAKKQETTL